MRNTNTENSDEIIEAVYFMGQAHVGLEDLLARALRQPGSVVADREHDAGVVGRGGDL